MRIGIDLGGTKIEAIALAADGRVLARRRIETPSGDYCESVQAILYLVQTLEGELGTRGSVGIGTPGAVSPATGRIKNANSTRLIGHFLERDLSSELGREVRISNDANCFALSEARDGAGANADVVFGAIIGTGTGAGIVVKGEVLTGRNAIAGEWGHNPLPWPQAGEWPGPPCYCGRRGCIETFLSGPAFARDYYEATQRALKPEAIVRMAEQGDRGAEACLGRYEDRMARSLSHVINILDPSVIVLGGGMSNVSRLYSSVPALWDKHVFSDRVDTRLSPPVHGDASGVRGAAWLWSLQAPGI